MSGQLAYDRIKWKRTIHELLGALDHKIVNLLLQDNLLCAWEGKVCPRCGKGSLSKLQKSSGHLPKYRCNAKACHVYLNPHHLHPLFVDGRGSGSTSLQLQAALLLLLLNRVPHPVIHGLLGVNHKAIEDMDKRLRDPRMKWVQEQEKHVNFGNGKKWCDVEADETTFHKQNLGNHASEPETPVIWEQWCGIVKRGCRQSLVLHRLNPKMSEARAPGPGAIRKVEWVPLAKTWLQDKQVILHTDAAKSYKCKVPGVIDDNVIHAKKRGKKNGKWQWRAPNYVLA